MMYMSIHCKYLNPDSLFVMLLKFMNGLLMLNPIMTLKTQQVATLGQILSTVHGDFSTPGNGEITLADPGGVPWIPWNRLFTRKHC